MRTSNMIHAFPKALPKVRAYESAPSVTLVWDEEDDTKSPTGSTGIYMSWNSRAEAIAHVRAILDELEALP